MSPKSITPHGIRRPAASRRPITFQSVTSQCVTWRGSYGASRSSARRGGPPERARELPPARVLDLRRDRRDHRAYVPGIPLQRAIGRRMLEPLERARDEARGLAQRSQDSRREVIGIDQRLPSMKVTSRRR